MTFSRVVSSRLRTGKRETGNTYEANIGTNKLGI